VSQFDEQEDEYLGTFLVWPIQAAELLLEQEQWKIFVSWNDEYEAGRVGTDSHPGHPGANERWHEIHSLLKTSRESIPSDARRAKAEMMFGEGDRRYTSSGPSYRLSWQLL
jgi:hypothetical protein